MENAVVPSPAQPGGTGFVRLSARGWALLALGVAALAAIVVATWLWSAHPTYRVLFTNLSDRDGGAIVAQ
ncbi:MAG: flagellar basal body M-ring protein FliF, partial [Burkholderiaceae bacterium]|nr:flagellar basal body M-ring protein FliF [Burkholderiaceae bacterium]